MRKTFKISEKWNVLNINTLSLGSKVLGYKLFRTIHIPKMLPLSVTVSVTNVCNSRCQTCYIWSLYREKPWLKDKELKTDEFEKIFMNIGRNAVWITISGGEPYLRHDLVRICEAAYEHCHPQILIIPTNCLLPSEIKYKTRKILEIYRNSAVIVNLSLDGIGKKHDVIRGVPGNFEKVISTYNELRELKKELPNLTLGVHSVASRFNI
ncbi:MAG: radical SAM protein, partial [Candidatus Bathyarchaeia archaeon]|nr:radical SAM protein [Candidatus Bathyarchaeia archaeon]